MWKCEPKRARRAQAAERARDGGFRTWARRSSQRHDETLQRRRHHLLAAHRQQVVALRPVFIELQRQHAKHLRKAMRHRSGQHRHAQAGLDQLRDGVEAVHLHARVQRAAERLGPFAHLLLGRGAGVQADDVVIQQRIEAVAAAARQRMPARHQDRQRALAISPAIEPGLADRCDENAGVGAPFDHGALHVDAGHLLQADADAGVGLGERRQVGRQVFGDRAGVRRHAQVALDAAGELGHLALQRMQRGMQRADVAQQRAPGLGGLDAARAALETGSRRGATPDRTAACWQRPTPGSRVRRRG